MSDLSYEDSPRYQKAKKSSALRISRDLDFESDDDDVRVSSPNNSSLSKKKDPEVLSPASSDWDEESTRPSPHEDTLEDFDDDLAMASPVSEKQRVMPVENLDEKKKEMNAQEMEDDDEPFEDDEDDSELDEMMDRYSEANHSPSERESIANIQEQQEIAPAKEKSEKPVLSLPLPREDDGESDEMEIAEQPKKKKGFRKLVSKAKMLSPFSSKKSKKKKTDTPSREFTDKEDVENESAVSAVAESSKSKSKKTEKAFSKLSAHSQEKESEAEEPQKMPKKVKSKSKLKAFGGGGDEHEAPQLESKIVEEEETPARKASTASSLFARAVSKTINKRQTIQGISRGGGSTAGRPGSGVLMEGWLKQKQRKGVRGMKQWNDRYFVLYSKLNEIRYYSEVVQSGWGPIPLGEIGAIPLRLIQRISRPNNPKYQGCRFDITCRSSWGTHYADDFVSSEEDEDEATDSKTGSRVYSLLADSPQTRVAWVNMLDSLLKRSGNSPRPDSTPAATGDTTPRGVALASQKSKRMNQDIESVHIYDTGDDQAPAAVRLAVKFLESATPGIEMKRFYELESSSSRVKASLQFLNQFAMDTSLKSPEQGDLEQYLDSVTAGAIFKQWLAQMEQPVIPFQFFDDFIEVNEYAEADPYEVTRTLKALVLALPKKNLAYLEFIVFHLASVAEYARENKLSTEVLAELFGESVLRPRASGEISDKEAQDAVQVLQHLITNAEAVF